MNGSDLHLPTSRLIGSAISLAQRGEFDAAYEIVEAIESRSLPGRSGPSETERRLLDAFRLRFPTRVKSQELIVHGPPIMAPDEVPVESPGVSLVSCCMNRSENLLKALPTWLANGRIDEVIIVDWSSTVPVEQVLRQAGVADPRIRVLRVRNEPRWILSFAFNIGFRHARHERILKVDADITLKADFFDRNPLPERSFIAGDWMAAEKGQEHINGFFYVRRKDLLKVRGFNEYITNYGWDDDDIYARLKESGLKRTCVDTLSIHHIPHDDAQRLGNSDLEHDNALTQLERNPLFRIRCNRYIAFVMPQWNKDRQFAPFRVLRTRDGYVELERCKEALPHIVNDEMRADAEHRAATELLSWRIGPEVYHLPRAAIRELLARRCLEQIGHFDVEVLSRNLLAAGAIRRHSLVLRPDAMLRPQRLAQLLAAIARQLEGMDVSIFVTGAAAAASSVRQVFSQCVELGTGFPLRGLESVREADIVALPDRLRACSAVLLHVTESLVVAALRSLPTASLLPPAGPGARAAKPRLIIDAQHGLGNRLRALASAGAIAQRTDRDLVVVWNPDHHCNCELRDLFQYDGPVLHEAGRVASPTTRQYNYMEIEAGASKGELIDLDHNDDVVVRSAYVLNHPSSAWEAENAFLLAMRPANAVRSLVETVDVTGCIAAHVRMEAAKGQMLKSYDAANNWSAESHEEIQYWRTKSHYSAFINRINALLNAGVGNRVFVAADMPETYSAFEQHFGRRLAFLARNSFDRSKENLIFALADAILLSKCTHLLGSTWSSFTELAQRFSTSIAAIETSGKDF